MCARLLLVLGTSARLLRLLTLLQSRSSWAGPELAGRLEVTPRTLRRDVDRLRSLGYPIAGAPGVAGGYVLGPGAALPPLSLDEDEATAIFVGLHVAAGTGVTGAGTSAMRALTKLERVLPTRLRKNSARSAARCSRSVIGHDICPSRMCRTLRARAA